MRARLLLLPLAAGALLAHHAFAQVVTPAQAPIILKPPPGVAPIPPAPLAPAPAALPPAVTAAPAAAAQRFRGTIQEFDGPFLTLKTSDKKLVTLGMTTATRLAHERILGLAGLQPGLFVSVPALKTTDGKLRAQGVRIIPRGMGEGQYAMDATGTRVVTNGTIATYTPAGIGGTLQLSFRGAAPDASGVCTGHAPAAGGCTGVANLIVVRGIPVLTLEASDTAALLPGALISVSAAPDANGTLVAVALTVEKDPPPAKGAH
ncbi:MAG: hypothetical protein JO167_12710 [Alphaproteobacteria bacterium]|nr:hypothetical protein [Alphaproteobacteria bacterium]MBV9904017.1 hypothetical protein [Alphaproteobacteria bacterium]